MLSFTLGRIIFTIATLIGVALLYVRIIAHAFRVGTTTADHPFGLFVTVMLLAGFAWIGLIPVLKKQSKQTLESQNGEHKWVWSIVVIGLGFRALFFGSVPIYEDDWNRYLWDGAVITQGIDPFAYSPNSVMTSSRTRTHPDVAKLQALSQTHGDVVKRINNPELTTIYPPVAQAVFALAALIKPFSLDTLRAIFLVCEAATLFLMIKALALYNRSPLWVTLYALNPLLIYSGFNAVHMDTLLPPFLLLALITVRKHPLWSAVALSGAVAVKIWPLLLAPVLFRAFRANLKIYIGAGLILTSLSAALLSPLLMHLGDNSGLSIYSLEWQFSSFIFPWIEKFIALVSLSPATLARLLIACILAGYSLWLGFMARERSIKTLPGDCLALTLALLLLSPTGYPWYSIWLLVFIPFVPLYSAALLTVTVCLYYMRYGLTELGSGEIYVNILVPIQFAPILLLFGFGYLQRHRDV